MVSALSQSTIRRASKDGARSDVICALAAVTWADTRRRRVFPSDRFTQALLEEPKVGRVLIADPYRSLPIRFARAVVGQSFERFPETSEHSLHQPMRLRRVDPRGTKVLERSYRAYDRRLRGAATRAGLERPTVITMNPLLAGFAPLRWAHSVTFYAEDDWSVAACFGRWRAGIEEAYRRIRVNRVRVCAVSEPIIDRIAPEGPCAVVPNGIEPQEWLTPRKAPDWFVGLRRPRILYLGTLDDRIDVASVTGAAERFPDGTVALVGRLADPGRFSALLNLPNVHLYEHVSRSDLLGLTRAADVGIVPHVRSPLTETMSPLKLYEYLAAGLPVSAIDLPPISAVDPGIVLVPQGGDFGASVAAALEHGRTAEEKRLAFIAANAWQRRHNDVLRLALA
jgi:glycosyltransferase involved in cell wall biosynthesis